MVITMVWDNNDLAQLSCDERWWMYASRWASALFVQMWCSCFLFVRSLARLLWIYNNNYCNRSRAIWRGDGKRTKAQVFSIAQLSIGKFMCEWWLIAALSSQITYASVQFDRICFSGTLCFLFIFLLFSILHFDFRFLRSVQCVMVCDFISMCHTFCGYCLHVWRTRSAQHAACQTSWIVRDGGWRTHTLVVGTVCLEAKIAISQCLFDLGWPACLPVLAAAAAVKLHLCTAMAMQIKRQSGLSSWFIDNLYIIILLIVNICIDCIKFTFAHFKNESLCDRDACK